MKESRTDIIDLIIHVLREHEESLDNIVNRMNSVFEKINVENLSYAQAQNVVKAYTKSLQILTDDSNKIEMCIENFVQDIYNMSIIKENWINSLIEYSINDCLRVELR